jgi:hypothetical protein
VLFVAEVQILRVPLFAELHAVRSAPEHGAPGPDELALFVKHHHAVGTLAVLVHRVMDVNVTLRILAHAMGIAVLDVAGQFTPIVDALVLLIVLS